MKKIELHVHLEGSIPLEALWELVKKYNKQDEVGSLEALKERFKFTDFLHFLQTWLWKNQFLLELDDFTFIAEAVANDMADQNIIYSEMFFSPVECEDRGLKIQDVTHAVRKGLNRVSNRIEINLIGDLVRNFGAEKGMQTLECLHEVQDQGVIGIGIGGNEADFPANLFTEVYEKARSYGFKTSAHAGEAAGADSIRQAIYDLKVDRIGHAYRILEDESLITAVKEKQIGLEMCPISNMRTGVFDPETGPHPIKKLFANDLLLSVNTDDPKMFHNTLVDEYEYLLSIGFSKEDLVQLNKSAIESAWCSVERKKELLSLLK